MIAAVLVIPAMALVRADPHSSAWWAGVVLNTVIFGRDPRITARLALAGEGSVGALA